MRTGLSCLVLFVIAMSATLAAADPGRVYLNVAGGGGGVWNQDNDQDIGVGPVALGALGWAVGNGFRFEGEVSWRKNPIELKMTRRILGVIPVSSAKRDSHLTNLAWMVNVAYDFTSDPLNGLFVLAGAGASQVDVEHDDSLSDTFFAFQGGAGWRFPVTDRMTVSLSYRVFGTPNLALDVFQSIDNIHHNGLLGLTASF